MRVLHLLAHPEPASFNGTLFRALGAHLREHGRDVRQRDLYAEGFEAVAGAGDFAERADPSRLNLGVEQEAAVRAGSFVDEIASHQRDLEWCDGLILQFPLWWFGPPAILKGWFDRVLAQGFAFEFGSWYEKGLLSGKRAMLVVSVGAPEATFGPRGINGSLDATLRPIEFGTLHFCGFAVEPRFVTFGRAAGAAEPDVDPIERAKARVLRFGQETPMSFPKTSEFGEGLVRPD